MPRLGSVRWPALSLGRMYHDIRAVGHGILNEFALIASDEQRIRNRTRGNENHHALARPEAGPETGPVARPSVPPNVTPRRTTRRDYELRVLRILEVQRFFRELADDDHPLNLPLSAEGQIDRYHILGDYRTNAFVKDLAYGRYDGYPEALRNQEYDSYYSDLRERMSSSSANAAIALGMMSDLQPLPSIALTIPPVYEPSDLPPYTATTSPPKYSARVPGNHIARDLPPCVAADCPVRQLGIEHSQGHYHHNGHVGPLTTTRGTWLPSFGRSNPPPCVWDAYNHIVLGCASYDHKNTVKAFVRYHGPIWKLTPIRPPPALVLNSDIPENMEQLFPHGTNQGAWSRIPCPQHENSTASEGFDKGRDPSIETYINSMHSYRELQVPRRRHHRYPDARTLAESTPNHLEPSQVASAATMHSTMDQIPTSEHPQPDPLSRLSQFAYQLSARHHFPADIAALIPEPLQIPSQRPSPTPGTSESPGEASRTNRSSCHQQNRERGPIVQVSPDPTLSDLARSPAATTHGLPSPDNRTPTNISSELRWPRPSERSHDRHLARRSLVHNDCTDPPSSGIGSAVSPVVSMSTASTTEGVHIRRQSFYGNVYNYNRSCTRRSSRRPLLGTPQPHLLPLRVTTAMGPVTSATSARTNQDSSRPLLPPQRAARVDAGINGAGGILGTFDWESNAEDLRTGRHHGHAADERNSWADHGFSRRWFC
ncbi:MAG: hypothetical protein L6R39_003701 [Caloplaca ligustica]|nr:MAG: hypothetical protein L6R39_003701 [Caloplaca ligustica]